jgi:hypothetical protein
MGRHLQSRAKDGSDVYVVKAGAQYEAARQEFELGDEAPLHVPALSLVPEHLIDR